MVINWIYCVFFYLPLSYYDYFELLFFALFSVNIKNMIGFHSISLVINVNGNMNTFADQIMSKISIINWAILY